MRRFEKNTRVAGCRRGGEREGVATDEQTLKTAQPMLSAQILAGLLSAVTSPRESHRGYENRKGHKTPLSPLFNRCLSLFSRFRVPCEGVAAWVTVNSATEMRCTDAWVLYKKRCKCTQAFHRPHPPCSRPSTQLPARKRAIRKKKKVLRRVLAPRMCALYVITLFCSRHIPLALASEGGAA